ncbi:MAG TPA: hypothetical protein VF389_11580 [Woeseiaceae bacterium]
MTDTTLLPCANQECRSTSVVFANYYRQGQWYTSKVKCLSCQLTGPLSPRYENEAQAEAEAVRLWNALPRPTEQDAVREAVELIDEVNLKPASREFYGIGTVLHAKLGTIRATLTELEMLTNG